MTFCTIMKKLILLILMLFTLKETNCLRFCNVKDPCATANSQIPFEPEMRSENCGRSKFCDVRLTPGWYKFQDEMLDYPPELNSCGADYPYWLNGNISVGENQEEERTVCKVGYTSSCIRQIKIKIRNCSTFTAYCLPALEGESERYCFGKNDSKCEAKSASRPATLLPTRNTTFESKINATKVEKDGNVFVQEEICSEDPCDPLNNKMKSIPKDSSENCNDASSFFFCHQHLEPGWYKTENPILNTCPSISSCGSIKPVWMNGSEPEQNDGVVKRKLCKVGTGANKCQQSTYVSVRNCGIFTLYCLAPQTFCDGLDCFGKLSLCSKGSRVIDVYPKQITERRGGVYGYWYIVLGTIIIVIAVMIIVFVNRRDSHKEEPTYEKTIKCDFAENQYEKLFTGKWTSNTGHLLYKSPLKDSNLTLKSSDENHYMTIQDCHI